MRLLGFIAVVITAALLISGARDFPRWGDPDSPANGYRVSEHYITETYRETQVPNLVTAVLADYRGFDTLFETVVIFTAGIAVIAILRKGPEPDHRKFKPKEGAIAGYDMIVGSTCRMLIPIIQLFALYVLVHGHTSPGGGFQAGVIFGASLILLALSRDLPAALRYLTERRAVWLACAGIFIYAGIGALCLLLGSNYLDYGVLHRLLGTSAVEARYHSILGVETGVAITVASIMFAIYASLSSKGRLREGL